MQAKVGDFGIMVASYDLLKYQKQYITDKMAPINYIPPELKEKGNV